LRAGFIAGARGKGDAAGWDTPVNNGARPLGATFAVNAYV
jgi:hypothetical protein